MYMDVGQVTAFEGIDWLTIIVALVVGLGGGVLGAIIAATTQKSLARAKSRSEAATALWNFHRALNDYALEQQSSLIKDGTAPVTKTTREDIAAQRSLAYPYKLYLGEHANVVERLWYEEWEQGMDPMVPSDDIRKWAKELEAALVQTFGKDGR